MAECNFWVYILRCSNGNFYTGYTTDMERRYKEHLQGTAKCKYTRSFKPVGIAQCWRMNANKSIVMKVERFIKSLSKEKKETLILSPNILLGLLPFEIEFNKIECCDMSV